MSNLESNVENDGLLSILKELSEEIEAPFDESHTNIEELEFKRRDGFIPFSHNKGGIDYIAFTDYRMLIVMEMVN